MFSETNASEKEYMYVAVRGLPLQCIALLFVIRKCNIHYLIVNCVD